MSTENSKLDVRQLPADFLLTPRQVAAATGVSPGKLRQYRHLGGGPSYVVMGHRTRSYMAGAVTRWLDELASTQVTNTAQTPEVHAHAVRAAKRSVAVRRAKAAKGRRH